MEDLQIKRCEKISYMKTALSPWLKRGACAPRGLVTGALASHSPEAQERADKNVAQLDEQSAEASFTVEGEVLEILGGFGLAHVRTQDGSTYGLNRETPGIQFAELHEGQRILVEVTQKFNRVLHAQLLG